MAIVSERGGGGGRGEATSYADEMLIRQKVNEVWTRTNQPGGRQSVGMRRQLHSSSLSLLYSLLPSFPNSLLSFSTLSFTFLLPLLHPTFLTSSVQLASPPNPPSFLPFPSFLLPSFNPFPHLFILTSFRPPFTRLLAGSLLLLSMQ